MEVVHVLRHDSVSVTIDSPTVAMNGSRAALREKNDFLR